jgi:simple sugar transport system ATP-binding protein
VTAAIELSGITKRFPGVIANDNVNLTVESGEIHAICGENGAGKSTLMKILYGMQPADEGTMRVKGELVNFTSPTDAIERGIGMVHQHFMLADQLTVLENVILGAEPVQSGGRIDFREAEEHLREVADEYGLSIDVNQMVETLEVGERQRVEIIKVLYRGADILILDEPTAVLVPQEVEALFENMRELKASGATILFIDHKLDEVLEIADSITVLRQGRTVETLENDGVTAADLAELMVGSELPTPETSESTVTDVEALVVRDLTVLHEDDRVAVDNVSLTIHKGEILGIAGVEGNGQGELVDAIIGTAHAAAGSIVLHGEDITRTSVRHRREAGIAYVPEDRHAEGLLLESPLWENAALGHQTTAPYGNKWFIDRAGARRQTERIREEFDVRTPNIDVKAHALSGGNQQKLIIGRELTSDPSVLIAAHPTRGIDVGAQAAVWEQIRRARHDGLATLLVSADLDELIGLSDSIVVMLRGSLVARLAPDAVTPRDLGAYMTGAATQDSTEGATA